MSKKIEFLSKEGLISLWKYIKKNTVSSVVNNKKVITDDNKINPELVYPENGKTGYVLGKTEKGIEWTEGYRVPEDGIPLSDLSEEVKSSLDKANSSLQKDDTYTKKEIEDLIPTKLSELENDLNLSPEVSLDNYYTKEEIEEKEQLIKQSISDKQDIISENTYASYSSVETLLGDSDTDGSVDNKISKSIKEIYNEEVNEDSKDISYTGKIIDYTYNTYISKDKIIIDSPIKLETGENNFYTDEELKKSTLSAYQGKLLDFKINSSTSTLENKIKTLGNPFTFKGIVNSIEELPNTSNNGDVYQLNDSEGDTYAWNGEEWIQISVTVSDILNYLATDIDVEEMMNYYKA